MKIFLIADDAPVIRKVLRRILEDIGFVVVEAMDASQAQQICTNNMPDAILVDWDMPGMKSLDLVHWLSPKMKEHGGKIIFCTSEVMVTEMTKAKRAGADAFLLKPFNRQMILDKLKEIGLAPEKQAAA